MRARQPRILKYPQNIAYRLNIYLFIGIYGCIFITIRKILFTLLAFSKRGLYGYFVSVAQVKYHLQ